MRKYILLLGLLTIALITLTACQDVYGFDTRHAEPEPMQEACAQTTADYEAVHAISWQEAYAEKLNLYAQQPATTAYIEAAEWRFMLHDINQYGTPQLFLVRYYDGLVSYYTVYNFLDGYAVPLKSAHIVNSLFEGGMYVAPDGMGIIRYTNICAVSHYDRLDLFGATLSRTANGDAVPCIDSFRVNTFPVSQYEFEYTFGCPNERAWLALYEITEANIQDIIFGW